MTVHDRSTRASDGPPEWGPPLPAAGPQEQSSGRRRGKLAVAGAVVAAAVVGAGVTAGVMADDGGSSASAAAGSGGRGFGQQGRAGGPGGATGGGTASALHGTYVVADGNGAYTTQLTQTGTVSAVSAGSITVKSQDGYTQTYVVSSSTSVDNGSDAIGDVAAGHTVRVTATSADDKATATQITDTNIASTQQQGGPGGAPPGGAQQGGTGTGT
jgi:hypothetical protein